VAINCNTRFATIGKAINQTWREISKRAFFIEVCNLINQYLATGDIKYYNEAIMKIVAEQYTVTQAETLLKFAFPELGPGPGGKW
jgi:hypothetical protein